MTQHENEQTVIISNEKLEGELVIPPGAKATILFAHGSGSSRLSTRNRYVAKVLNDAGFATLLVDLLTSKEKEIDERSRHLRFDIDLLTSRIVAVTRWLVQEPATASLKIGYFGSSTGAAAALIAEAKLGDVVKAIVCRGGRPDLADEGILPQVVAPTLLVVGGNDTPVIGINKAALRQLSSAEARELAVIPGAGHLFEEPDKMEKVAKVAAEWFECYLHRNGRKFKNKYSSKAPRLLSAFKERPHMQLRFTDRMAAGEILALLFRKYKNNDITVIAIPRGGVVVADVIAKQLKAEFDIVVPRKLRAPDNSENAIGSIMQDGSIYLDSTRIKSMQVSDEYLESEISEQKKEIDRRMHLYRPDRKEYNIRGRRVILIDDGAATGATIIAAARWIRRQEPRLLAIGIPVAPENVVDLLAAEADDIQVIRKPSSSTFKAVEHFYKDYQPVSDSQVTQIVRYQR